MRVWVRRLALIVALLVVVGYAGLCLWLRVNETRLAYSRSHPYVPPPSSLALHEQRVHLGDVDGTPLYAWVVHSLPEDASSNRWVVFFHGTGDNALEHECGRGGKVAAGRDVYRFTYLTKDGHGRWEIELREQQIRDIAGGLIDEIEAVPLAGSTPPNSHASR